jgi:adenylate kinase
MARGELVPDSVTIGVLRNAVVKNPDAGGFIFDGFPRTIAQAKALDDLLMEQDQEVSLLIALAVPEDEIVNRILLRGKTSGRPDDNDPAVIRKRIRVYEEETAQVFHYYEEYGVSFTADGVGSIDEIFERLCELIEDNDIGWLDEEE